MTSLFRRDPLFHARVHPKQIAAFASPDDLERRHAVALGFVDALKRGRLDDKKEVRVGGDVPLDAPDVLRGRDRGGRGVGGRCGAPGRDRGAVQQRRKIRREAQR